MAQKIGGFDPDILVHPVVLTDKDAQEINQLLKQLSESAKPISAEQIRAINHQDNFRLILLKDPSTDKIIGMTSVTVKRILMRTSAFIDDVVVDRMYRGLGLGEVLMKFAIATAKNENAEYVSLTSNPKRKAANGMYLKLKFQIIGHTGESNYYRLKL